METGIGPSIFIKHISVLCYDRFFLSSLGLMHNAGEKDLAQLFCIGANRANRHSSHSLASEVWGCPVLCLVIRNRVSLCDPGWLGTQCFPFLFLLSAGATGMGYGALARLFPTYCVAPWQLLWLKVTLCTWGFLLKNALYLQVCYLASCHWLFVKLSKDTLKVIATACAGTRGSAVTKG